MALSRERWQFLFNESSFFSGHTHMWFISLENYGVINIVNIIGVRAIFDNDFNGNYVRAFGNAAFMNLVNIRLTRQIDQATSANRNVVLFLTWIRMRLRDHNFAQHYAAHLSEGLASAYLAVNYQVTQSPVMENIRQESHHSEPVPMNYHQVQNTHNLCKGCLDWMYPCGICSAHVCLTNLCSEFGHPKSRCHSVALRNSTLQSTVTSPIGVQPIINGDSDMNEDICAICMEKLKIEQFVKLECKHSFHSDCFGKIASKLCPLCRKRANIQSTITPAGADIPGTSRWSHDRPSDFSFYYDAGIKKLNKEKLKKT